MRPKGIIWGIAFLPVLACCVLAGCEEEVSRPRPTGPRSPQDQKPPEELVTTGWGRVTGRIIYPGEAPKMQPIAAMKFHADRACCLAGREFEKCEQTWLVGADGGVK